MLSSPLNIADIRCWNNLKLIW